MMFGMADMDDEIRSYEERRASDRRTTEALIAEALVDFDSVEAEEAVSIIHYRASEVELRAGMELCRAADPRRRWLGAWILGQLGVHADGLNERYREEAIGVLIPMLEDEDPEVIGGALVALRFRADERALAPMLRLIGHGDSEIRYCLALALRSYADPESLGALILLTRDEAAQVRDWATFGLRLRNEADSAELREALIARLEDEDEEVRGEAMIALAMRRDRRIVPAMRRALEQEEMEGDWVFEAAWELADPEIYEDLKAWAARPSNWEVNNDPEHWVWTAMEACRAGR
jgi:HEAT repeat protein